MNKEELQKAAMKTREKTIYDVLTWDEKSNKEKAKWYDNLMEFSDMPDLSYLEQFIDNLESSRQYWKAYALELESKLKGVNNG